MDGGTIWNINIDAAVKGCLAKGFAENEIIVDISLCFYYAVETETDVSDKATANWLENLHIHRFYQGITSTYQEMYAYPEVNFRYYLMNENPALAFKMLDFNTDATWPLQLDGRATAEAAIAAGAGVGFEAVRNWQENQGDVRSKFKHFGDYYRAHISRV